MSTFNKNFIRNRTSLVQINFAVSVLLWLDSSISSFSSYSSSRVVCLLLSWWQPTKQEAHISAPRNKDRFFLTLLLKMKVILQSDWLVDFNGVSAILSYLIPRDYWITFILSTILCIIVSLELFNNIYACTFVGSHGYAMSRIPILILFIWPLDGTLTGRTISGQNEPGRNSNEGAHRIPQISRTGTSPKFCVIFRKPLFFRGVLPYNIAEDRNQGSIPCKKTTCVHNLFLEYSQLTFIPGRCFLIGPQGPRYNDRSIQPIDKTFIGAMNRPVSNDKEATIQNHSLTTTNG